MSDRERLLTMERATIEAIAEIDTDPRRAGISLHVVRRMISDWLDEFTPVRPPSRADLQATRETAERFSADRVREILKEGQGE